MQPSQRTACVRQGSCQCTQGLALYMQTILSVGDRRPGVEHRRTNQNVSILSTWTAGTISTFSMEAYPPWGTLQCFSNAWKIFQPSSLYFSFPVDRYARKSDSTVSGLTSVEIRPRNNECSEARLTAGYFVHQ